MLGGALCSLHTIRNTYPYALAQVVWLGRPESEISWVPASALNPQLILEFEDGVKYELSTENTTSYGHICTTLSVTATPQREPSQKKKKQDHIVVENTAG